MRRLLLTLSLLCIPGCGQPTTYWTERLRDPDPLHRIRAIHALQQKTGEQQIVVPVLVAALDDENTYVRRNAARALVHFGPGALEAIPALRARLTDPQPGVRKAAAQTLAMIDPAVAERARIR